MSFSWRKNLNALLTIVAVVLAIGVGVALRSSGSKWTERQIAYLGFPGELFLRALKALIIPLIVSSLVSALGSLDSRFAGRVGSRAVIYYLITTALAIGLGILLVLTIRPGAKQLTSSGNDTNADAASSLTSSTDTILDLIRNLIPPNLVEACFAQYSTYGEADPKDATHVFLRSKRVESTNILGLVVFSILLGVVCSRLREAGRPIIELFTCLSEASMSITRIIIHFTPIGVLFLVLPRVVEVDNVAEMLESVGLYTATIMSGLLIHGLIVLPILYAVTVRANPYRHIGRMSSALMTAFATSSSSATLPVTINCLEENVGLDPRIVRFLVPIGATVNMDGTALYEAVAAIFIAQSRGLPLGPVQVIIVSITATFASIGAAGIPQAGLVTMVIVLNAVGLPAADVYLIFVVDWFLDRFRTVINVLGDSFGAAVISHVCPKSDFMTDTDFSYDFPSRNSSTKKKEETGGGESMIDLRSVTTSVCGKCASSNGGVAGATGVGSTVTAAAIQVLEKSPKLTRAAAGIRESEH